MKVVKYVLLPLGFVLFFPKFLWSQVSDDLVITEIMYNSPVSGSDTLEFIEVYNASATDVNLNGYAFTSGVNFVFPNYILPYNSHVLICEDSLAMFRQFGVVGFEWSGALSNSGELIILEDGSGNVMDSVHYDDGSPWPTSADGDGFSLVFCETSQDNGQGSSWDISQRVTGLFINGLEVFASPGLTDEACITNITLVSDSSWVLSSVVTSTTANSYPWPGVSSIPDDSSFHKAVAVTQPYPWVHLYSVTGSEVIAAESGVTYYKNTFDLTQSDGLNLRLRMFVDDDMQVFINGHWVAIEDGMGSANWRTENHDILFLSDGTVHNGYLGGDAFDYYTLLTVDSLFVVGTNEIVLAIRNRTSKPDLGGFSFRMDVVGEEVISKSAIAHRSSSMEDLTLDAQIFPNPNYGKFNISFSNLNCSQSLELLIVDMEGRVLMGKVYNQLQLAELVSVELSGFAKGLYSLKLTNGNRTMVKRIYLN